MEFKTENIKVAILRIWDQDKGRLVAYDEVSDQSLLNAPRVVLYENQGQMINLFSPDEKDLPVLQRVEDKLVSLREGQGLSSGVCLVVEPRVQTLEFNRFTCTLDDIKKQVLASNDAFLYRDGLIDERLRVLDTWYEKSPQDESYAKAQMALLAKKHEDKKSYEQFEATAKTLSGKTVGIKK